MFTGSSRALMQFMSNSFSIRVTSNFINSQRSLVHIAGRLNRLLPPKGCPTTSSVTLRFYVEKADIPQSQQTFTDIKNKLAVIMGVKKGFRPLPASRTHLQAYLPENQEQMPYRTMKDSFDSALIPLSTNHVLQDRYMTLMGYVRKGRLLEDMDLFAVWICLKYISNPKYNPNEPYPYTLVTAGVDQITFQSWNCKVTDDMRISGQVQWVGKSSMEICVWLESLMVGEWKLFTKAYFIMVARNSTNSNSSFVNKLKPEGVDEVTKYEHAQKRMKKRQMEKKTSLLKIPPTEDEQKRIHDTFMKTIDFKDVSMSRRVLPSNAVWMEATKITNMMFPHPEDRNTHNTVFGGLLMRLSSELSWIVAYTFGKQRPLLRHISDIEFKSPVSINSFVKMSGQVVYTQLNYAQIVVMCELMDIITGKMVTTNVFNYTYEFNHILQEVVPQTYLEAMMWLDGSRHFHEIMEQNV